MDVFVVRVLPFMRLFFRFSFKQDSPIWTRLWLLQTSTMPSAIICTFTIYRPMLNRPLSHAIWIVYMSLLSRLLRQVSVSFLPCLPRRQSSKNHPSLKILQTPKRTTLHSLRTIKDKKKKHWDRSQWIRLALENTVDRTILVIT